MRTVTGPPPRRFFHQAGACVNTLSAEKPYADMYIAGVTGISDALKAALVALGAVEDA